MTLLLGAIADDFTGATDLANTLARGGMRTRLSIGVPADASGEADDGRDGGADAVVVALKSRSTPPADAVAQSLAALDWLEGRGVRQVLFKYCSTFDSTDRGNIGPVTDALLDRLGGTTVACPAFPATGRTVYQGHLFVGDRLLSESGMRDHPLTPMRDADLVRVLSRQSRNAVGLVPWRHVAAGPEAVRSTLGRLADEGRRIAVVDAVCDADLHAIGGACRDFRLITGASGVAMGLPANFRASGLLPERPEESWPAIEGAAVVLSGSCSPATRAQVAAFSDRHPAFRLRPEALAEGSGRDEALAWAESRLGDGPLLIHAGAVPEEVARVQDALGREQAGRLVEEALAGLAVALRARGVGRLVVAGGETSGAVVAALGVRWLRIGGEIAPGVPWTVTDGTPPLGLVLKSGNFGGPDFFAQALSALP
jgi:3-dehydrotetronate 4-kinase